MKTEKDLYKVLGVSETSSKEEIDRQYRKLAAKYHPDRFSEDNEKKDAEKQFENISQAYNVLSNEKSRSEYNARRKFGFDQRRSNNSQFNQFDFEDLNSSGSN